MKTGGTNVLLDLRGGLHDCAIFLTMPCVTGQYSELLRAIVGSLSSAKEAPGPPQIEARVESTYVYDCDSRVGCRWGFVGRDRIPYLPK